MYNGIFLPNLSSKGPYNNCPIETPMKKLETESDTFEIVVARSSAMAGKPGKYMSIENGPNADKSPNVRIAKNLCFPFFIILHFFLVDVIKTITDV